MTTVSVFGGTGFLGRRLVRRLATEGMAVRVVARHADRARSALHAAGLDRVSVFGADVRDQATVAAVRRRGRRRRRCGLRLCRPGRNVRGGARARRQRLWRGRLLLPVSPASCSFPASAPIPSPVLRTSARADAANARSSKYFRVRRSFARVPCSGPATRCSARSPISPDCSQCCR